MATNEFNQILERLDRMESMMAVLTKDVINVDECAALTGFSPAHIYRLVSQNEIPHYKPTGKTILFKKPEIIEWLFRIRISTNEEIESKAATYIVKSNLKKKRAI